MPSGLYMSIAHDFATHVHHWGQHVVEAARAPYVRLVQALF